jgi:hypothetical protein
MIGIWAAFSAIGTHLSRTQFDKIESFVGSRHGGVFAFRAQEFYPLRERSNFSLDLTCLLRIVMGAAQDF